MKLYDLMKRVKTDSKYDNCEISFVTDRFDDVKEGCIFVCIKGKKFDAHTIAGEALKKGAEYVVVEKDVHEKKQIIVESSREAYTLLCSALYGDPADKIKMIGLTGTNGKTSTAFLLRELLEASGHKTGLIGTVENIVGDKHYIPNLTTPQPTDLFKLISEMAKIGCEYCVMETSSQALHQRRLAGINFEVGIFTNITVDHLDYHGTMEEYKKAKKMLFEHSKKAVINLDDENALFMTEGLDIETVTYSSKDDKADYTAKNVELFDDSIKYELVGMNVIGRVKLNIPGKFSVYNSMAAAVAALELGAQMPKISDAFSKSSGVKGRMETVPTGKDYTVIIDYAHTPDGLENLLSSVRKVYSGRIITVFGCGGDRDKSKRPVMGKLVGDMADVAVVTSDNPRTEDPEMIINDILAGMENVKAKRFIIPNRTDAIRKALSIAKKGDVVVLAGKGHETYQILNTGKIHYDEREIVKEILSNK